MRFRPIRGSFLYFRTARLMAVLKLDAFSVYSKLIGYGMYAVTFTTYIFILSSFVNVLLRRRNNLYLYINYTNRVFHIFIPTPTLFTIRA